MDIWKNSKLLILVRLTNLFLSNLISRFFNASSILCDDGNCGVAITTFCASAAVAAADWLFVGGCGGGGGGGLNWYVCRSIWLIK